MIFIQLKYIKLPHLFFLCLFLIGSFQSYAQKSSIKKQESKLKRLYGVEKLKALNTLTAHYHQEGSRKAVKYGRQAVELGENLFDKANHSVDRTEHKRLIQSYAQLGIVLYERDDLSDAKAQLEKGKKLSDQLNDQSYFDIIEQYLGKIQQLIDEEEEQEGLFSKLENLKIGESIHKASQDVKIQSEITLGAANEKKKDYEKAIAHYAIAVNLLQEKGNYGRASEIQIKIAALYDKLNRPEEVQKILEEAIKNIESSADTTNIITDKAVLKRVTPSLTDKELSRSLRVKQKELKDLSEDFARRKDFEKSLAYYKLYQELTKKMETDSLKAEIEKKQKANEIFLLKQQKAIADLQVKSAEAEKEKQIRWRNTSVLIALLVLMGTGGISYFYLAKRKEHYKLSLAYHDLDQTKEKLEKAEQRIVKLLSQQVSGDVAMKLMNDQAKLPVERRFVCIMFLDIRGFTPKAEKLSPEELIAYQNKVFGFMIDIIEGYHGTINQLLGDGFMATFGAPISHGNDCQHAFDAANTILNELKLRNDAGVFQQTKIGIGLHAGFVVTGNVGTETRKQYSVTGNPVIIASRVEQLNKTYQSQCIITEDVYEKLETHQIPANFEAVQVKGRSEPVNILVVA
ncbi:MAG: adenylate/guanylate cyclase domain-containing protein [Flammeovirgaceae bacterium]